MNQAATYDRPSYAIDSLETQIKGVIAQHLTAAVSSLEHNWRMQVRDELEAMRAYVDGRKTGTSEFWYREGFRRRTEAYEKAYRLAVFRDALSQSDVAYVRCGRDFMPDVWLVYVRDLKSPSSVRHVASMERCPEADALVDASKRCTLSPTEGLARNARL